MNRAARTPPLGAVIVDLDNTLYDFEAAYAHAVDALIAAIASDGVVPIAIRDRYETLRRQPPAGTPTCGRDIRVERLQRLVASWPATEPLDPSMLADRFERAMLERTVPFPNALEALRTVRARWPLLIVSDGWRDIQMPIMKALGLDPAVWPLLSTFSEGTSKADGSAYQRAVEMLETAADQIIVAGDNWDLDVVAPSRLGLRTLWISKGRPQPRPAPTAFAGSIETIAALPALLDGRAQR